VLRVQGFVVVTLSGLLIAHVSTGLTAFFKCSGVLGSSGLEDEGNTLLLCIATQKT
jgi:hypothetical protein